MQVDQTATAKRGSDDGPVRSWKFRQDLIEIRSVVRHPYAQRRDEIGTVVEGSGVIFQRLGSVASYHPNSASPIYHCPTVGVQDLAGHIAAVLVSREEDE